MKPLVTKCSGSKTRPERLRTCSSDSGCDVQCEGLVDIQEDSIPHSTIRYCESRLQEIIKINLKQSGLAALKSDQEAWRRQLAQSLHLTANQIYWEIQELKEMILSGNDQDRPLWQKTSLVIEELEELHQSEDSCCSCSNTDTAAASSDTDSLTGWSIWDKFGEVWEEEEEEELPVLDLPHSSSRRTRVRKDTDLREIFWQICLETSQTNTALQEMDNLPSWDSPDIFLDSEESAGEAGADRDDSIEIFQSSWDIFTEPKDKTWTEQQKFGVSWWDQVDQVEYYQDTQPHQSRLKKHWSPVQLCELIESLESINLSVEEPQEPQEPAVTTEEINQHPAATWQEEAKFGPSWAGYFEDLTSDSTTEAREKSYIWSRENIGEIIERLQPIDFDANFLTHLVIEEDLDDIFEANKGIFETEPEEDHLETAAAQDWSDQHRFGGSWGRFVAEYDCEDPHCHWNFSHKFGVSWAAHLAQIETDHLSQLRAQVGAGGHTLVSDLLDVFWSIALDRGTNILQPKLRQIMRNLPASDSPDVFMDSSLMFYQAKAPKICLSQEEILDIFNTGKSIFATFDNQPEEEISIFSGDETHNNDQKERKPRKSALKSIKTLFTRFKFSVKKEADQQEISTKKNNKVRWKKMTFPKLRTLF